MLCQTNCLKDISGAYGVTPISNLEVEVGVPPLGTHVESNQAQFRVWLELSEVVRIIREVVNQK
jgi:hypothetical protein